MNSDSRIDTTARVFVALLRYQLTEEQFNEMCRRNAAETNEGICHSHDFCDANMVMLDAFHAVCPDVDSASDFGVIIWNDAWAAAMPALSVNAVDSSD
jgi:hypothetical protein